MQKNTPVTIFLFIIAYLSLLVTVDGSSAHYLEFEEISDTELAIVGCDPQLSYSLIIPETHNGRAIVEIKDYAFKDVYFLSSVSIPKTVTHIGIRPFPDPPFFDPYMIRVDVHADNPNYSSEDGVLFNKDKTELIFFPNHYVEDHYRIPDTVQTIKTDAFYRLLVIDSFIIEIPSSVIEIEQHAFVDVDSDLLGRDTIIYFAGDAPSTLADDMISTDRWNDMPTIYYHAEAQGFTRPTWSPVAGDIYDTYEIPAGIELLSWENHDTYIEITDCDSDVFVRLTIPDTIEGLPVERIGQRAFEKIYQLREVTLPDTITHIGDHAFYFCFSLESVNLPEGLLSIGESAFAATSIRQAALPQSLTNLGTDSFSGTDLASLTIPVNVHTIRGNPIPRCTYLTDFQLDAANPHFTMIDGVLFSADLTRLIVYPTSKRTHTTYDIPQSVVAISDSAFENNSALEVVTLPPGLTSIGSSAFNGCLKLQSPIFPTALTSIGSFAYNNCGITSLHISEAITHIGTSAFSISPQLTQITVDPENPNYKSVDGVLFSKDGKTLYHFPSQHPDTHYVVPSGVITIDKLAFSYTNFSAITLPQGLTTIDDINFYSSINLSSIVFPGTVTFIGQHLFGNTYPSFVVFEGDAPIMGKRALPYSTKVYYMATGIGFTTPTWTPFGTEDVYECAELAALTPTTSWLLHNSVRPDTDFTEDTNNDGVNLLLEYALGLDPREANGGNVPQPVFNDNLLELTYYAQSQDITYTVETSTDLINWTTTGVTTTAPNANGNATASVDISDGAQHFMRLVVAEQ